VPDLKEPDSPTDVCSVTGESPTAVQSPLCKLDIKENEWLRCWREGDRIGQGAYGEVFKAMVHGHLTAVKKICLDLDPENPEALEHEIDAVLLEINTMRQLDHPRIVRYLGCIREDTPDSPQLCIFMEFMSSSISALLAKFGPYGIACVRKYARQILEGLCFLHSKGIVHRDVKGANILIGTQGDAKLADFGCCRQIEQLHNTMTGSLHEVKGSVFWMAPEVLKANAGRRSDVWSTGCTVLEMLTAEPPWPNLRQGKSSLAQALQRIADGPDPPPFPKDVPEDCSAFLMDCFIRDHQERPYADVLLMHRFINVDSEGAT
jgi:serine/threonine protein kinase